METGSAEQSLGAEMAGRPPGAVQAGEGDGWDWSRGARDRALRDVSNRKQIDHGDRGAAGAEGGSRPAADPPRARPKASLYPLSGFRTNIVSM